MRYKGINFDNYYQYEQTNKGAITKIKKRPGIDSIYDFMHQNDWKIN